MGVNLCFTSWSANCRACSLSAKKLFPSQGASDFFTHWWGIGSLHTAQTLGYHEAVSELHHSKTAAKRGWVQHTKGDFFAWNSHLSNYIFPAMPIELSQKSHHILTFCLNDSNPVTWFQQWECLLPAVCTQLIATQIGISAEVSPLGQSHSIVLFFVAEVWWVMGILCNERPGWQ